MPRHKTGIQTPPKRGISFSRVSLLCTHHSTAVGLALRPAQTCPSDAVGEEQDVNARKILEFRSRSATSLSSEVKMCLIGNVVKKLEQHNSGLPNVEANNHPERTSIQEYASLEIRKSATFRKTESTAAAA